MEYLLKLKVLAVAVLFSYGKITLYCCIVFAVLFISEYFALTAFQETSEQQTGHFYTYTLLFS